MITDNIKQEQDDKLAAYLDQVWNGVLPSDFIELFKTAILHAPIGLRTATIKDICSKTNAELPLRYVGIIQEAIRNCPMYLLFPDLNTAIHKHEQIEKVADKFKMELSLKQRELDIESRNKTALLTGGNGLRKI